MYNRSISKLQETCLKVIVVTLPFTQLLSLPVGFPLKIYELYLFVLLGLYILRKRFPFSVSKKLSVILACLALIGLFSTIVNIIDWYPYSLTNTETRFGYFGDSLMKYFYFLLCVFAFLSFYKQKESFKYKVLKLYLIGGYVASFFSFYIFIFSGLRLPVIELPGYEPQMWMWFVRNGTFKEANYLAAYLLTCIGIALYFKKRWGVCILLAALVTTVSTAGLVTSFCLIGLYFVEFKMIRYIKIRKVFISIIAITILIGIIATPIFQEVVLSKLSFSKGSEIESNNDYSRVERTNQSAVGLKIGAMNPILGVGLSNYSRHYKEYNTDMRFNYPSSFKPIPNNVYVELFSEWGILGLIVFIVFSFSLLKEVKVRVFRLTYLMLMVYFIAFPTFTLLFIWVFAAIITKSKTEEIYALH